MGPLKERVWRWRDAFFEPLLLPLLLLLLTRGPAATSEKDRGCFTEMVLADSPDLS